MSLSFPENLITLAVSAGMLIFSGFAALILAACFRKPRFVLKSGRCFFRMAISVMSASFAAAIVLLYEVAGEPDQLQLFFAIVAVLGLYTFEYLYICYLALNHEVYKNKRLRTVLPYLALAVCTFSTVMWILSLTLPDFFVPPGERAYFVPAFWARHAADLVLGFLALGIILEMRSLLDYWHGVVLMIPSLMILIAVISEPAAEGVALRIPGAAAGLLVLYIGQHRELELMERSNEVSGLKGRMELALGRMKPHYIGNLFATSYYLCDTDPEQAQNTITTFSEYMINTLETISQTGLIPFTQEINQTETYLSLEKLRFEDQLRVNYDMDVEDFVVPPLTIQALVENAVKHGIANLNRPGTVRIETRRLANGGVRIRVVDDGVGFDVGRVLQEQSNEPGELLTVRDRFRQACGGDMTIESTPGEGTAVTITLPPPQKIRSETT